MPVKPSVLHNFLNQPVKDNIQNIYTYTSIHEMWHNLDYLLSQFHVKIVKIALNLLNFAWSFTKWPLHWVTSLTLDRLCSSLPQGQGWGCPPQQQGSFFSFCQAWTTLWGQSCSEGLHCGFQPDCFLFKRFLKHLLFQIYLNAEGIHMLKYL